MKKKLIKIISVVLAVICGFSVPYIINASKDDETQVKAEVPVAAYAAATGSTTERTKVTTVSATTTKPAFEKYTVYVKVGTAKIRKNASSKSKVICSYHKGKKLTVIGKSGNWRKVGKNKWIHKDNISTKNPMGTFQGYRLKYYDRYNVCSKPLTRSMGVKRYNGHRETWYSTKEYGQSRTAYTIKGGKHLDKDGIYRDADGYICVAASRSQYKAYTKLMTSRGPAKVYDCGCAYGTIDIYTNW